MQVTQADMPNVDIKLSDRGGKILVSVRSESAELAQSLRSDLGELVSRLEHHGYQTETVAPSTVNSSTHVSMSSQESAEQGASGNRSQQQNQQESRRQPQPEPDLGTFSLEENFYDDNEPA